MHFALLAPSWKIDHRTRWDRVKCLLKLGICRDRFQCTYASLPHPLASTEEDSCSFIACFFLIIIFILFHTACPRTKCKIVVSISEPFCYCEQSDEIAVHRVFGGGSHNDCIPSLTIMESLCLLGFVFCYSQRIKFTLLNSTAGAIMVLNEGKKNVNLLTTEKKGGKGRAIGA